MSNTAFQLAHFSLIEKGLDLQSFIMNNDWSETLIKQLYEYMLQLCDVIESSEFSKLQEILRKASSIKSQP